MANRLTHFINAVKKYGLGNTLRHRLGSFERDTNLPANDPYRRTGDQLHQSLIDPSGMSDADRRNQAIYNQQVRGIVANEAQQGWLEADPVDYDTALNYGGNRAHWASPGGRGGEYARAAHARMDSYTPEQIEAARGRRVFDHSMPVINQLNANAQEIGQPDLIYNDQRGSKVLADTQYQTRAIQALRRRGLEPARLTEYESRYGSYGRNSPRSPIQFRKPYYINRDFNNNVRQPVSDRPRETFGGRLPYTRDEILPRVGRIPESGPIQGKILEPEGTVGVERALAPESNLYNPLDQADILTRGMTTNRPYDRNNRRVAPIGDDQQPSRWQRFRDAVSGLGTRLGNWWEENRPPRPGEVLPAAAPRSARPRTTLNQPLIPPPQPQPAPRQVAQMNTQNEINDAMAGRPGIQDAALNDPLDPRTR